MEETKGPCLERPLTVSPELGYGLHDVIVDTDVIVATLA